MNFASDNAAESRRRSLRPFPGERRAALAYGRDDWTKTHRAHIRRGLSARGRGVPVPTGTAAKCAGACAPDAALGRRAVP